MKQVLQDIRSGEVSVQEVPEPVAAAGSALVAVERSLISPGTERALVDLGAKSLLQKARARPDLVRKTIAVARSEGIGTAMTKVKSRLGRYTELGYSLSGRVLETGGDPRLAPGARVACVGAGYASHAEVVSVPANLVVPLPDGVSADEAAFAAPAAIALHAIRLAGVQAGEVVAVIGLGLIGQLAGRLLRASGCIAVGTDRQEERQELFGTAGNIHALVAEASRGRGADAVLVCAATDSNEPVELAAELARDRARVVVVGDVGLELDRRVFYEKELSLVVARSYGPGRYERAYEERGLDFPAGYVRWTEGRNVEAVVDLLAGNRVSFADLVTHRFPIGEAEAAYGALADGALGILLEFEAPAERRATIRRPVAPRPGALRVGLVGAGEFARSTLVPALKANGDVHLAAVCARSGASAKSLADRYEIPVVTTDWRGLAESGEVDALVIATPHSEHAEMAAVALEGGKSVFVEKPLAISWAGLERVREAAAGGGLLLVGHNRRFAPLAVRLRDAVGGPLVVQIRVAAGSLPPGHWLDDPEEGGRVLGEISHFVDLASFLVGSAPVSVFAAGGDSLAATLRFRDGSAASIVYGTGESGDLPKERIEALGRSAAGVIDDFRRLELHGAGAGVTKARRDKGHAAQLAAFVAAARGAAEPPVPIDEQLQVAAASLALLDSARTGEPVDVPA